MRKTLSIGAMPPVEAKYKARFSEPQLDYARARVIFDMCYKAARDYDRLMDAEATKLGLPTPFAILPEGHPMMAEAQRLLDMETAAKKLMYLQANALFDWALVETFAHTGTPKQHAAIREAVIKVKEMAWVEAPWIEMVDLSMRLPKGKV